MKITNLTESSTTAGAVAPVSVPFKSVQKREAATVKGKGSLLKGIKTSEKYANSVTESKEEKIKKLRQDYADKKRWASEAHSTTEKNQHERGAMKIADHLKKQYNTDISEDAGTGPNTDSILEYLTKAYRAIVNSGEYSDRGNQLVKTVYGVLREPLMQGDMTQFSTRYDYASAKYPDVFDELISRMYAEAGLGDNGTYDQFIAKVSEGLAEGFGDIVKGVTRSIKGKSTKGEVSDKIDSQLRQQQRKHVQGNNPENFRKTGDRISQLSKRQSKVDSLGMDEAKEKTTRVDMMGKTCDRCKKDKFKERSQHDDMQGQVTCSCGNRVTRHQDKKVATEAEIKENDLVLTPGKGRQHKPGLLNKPEVSVNPTDVVKLDVPLLIRLLEFSKEDAQSDMDLHELAEKLVAGSARGRTLTMKDYDSLIPEVAPKQEVDEAPTRNTNLPPLRLPADKVKPATDAITNSLRRAQERDDIGEDRPWVTYSNAQNVHRFNTYEQAVAAQKKFGPNYKIASADWFDKKFGTEVEEGIGEAANDGYRYSKQPWVSVIVRADAGTVIPDDEFQQLRIRHRAQQWGYNNGQLFAFANQNDAKIFMNTFGGEIVKTFNQGATGEPIERDVTEANKGRFVRGPDDSGNIVDYDRQGNPKEPKPAKVPTVRGPRKDVNGMTRSDYDTVWRKIEDVVGQIFPDGDPIDWMAPWLKRNGAEEFKIGDILDKACKLNGYSDMYAYYDSMKTGDYGYEPDHYGSRSGEREELDEVSADTLASYQQKANFDARGAHSRLNSFEPGIRTTPGDASHEADKKLLRKRTSGIGAAQRRTTNKGNM